MRELTKEQLDEIKAKNHPHASCALLGLEVSPKEGSTQAEADALTIKLDAYFKIFTYLENGHCPGCESELGGFFSSFKYDFQHGEGHCHVCGWPCRADHYVKDVFTWRMFVLPYHPDGISIK